MGTINPRKFCTGVPKRGEDRFPMTPVICKFFTVIVSGSQWFSVVLSGFWEAISINGAIEIILLLGSLCIQICALPFADQIFTFNIRNHWEHVGNTEKQS